MKCPLDKGPVEKAAWGLRRAAELFVSKRLSEGFDSRFVKDESVLLEGAALEYAATVRAEKKGKK